MYLVVLDGGNEQVMDLGGLYRLIARSNPLDNSPMNLDGKAVTMQMTCAKDDCLLPISTREALHALVWGAAAGAVTAYRFENGQTIAVRVRPGTEYKQPPKEYGEIKAAGGAATTNPGVGSSGSAKRYGVGGRR